MKGKNFQSIFISLLLGLLLVFLWLSVIPVGKAQEHHSQQIPIPESRKTSISSQELATESYSISEVISSSAGLYSSLAVGPDGILYASFTNDNSDALYYGVYSGTDWIVGRIDTGDSIGRNDIAIDPNNGDLHLSYQKDNALWYAHGNGTTWISSSLAAGNHRQNAIAIDSNGFPHIAYSTDWISGGFWFGHIVYTRWNGTAWETQTLYTDDEEVHAPIRLVLDSNDDPHVLFKKRDWGGYFGVFLQSWLSPTWQTTPLQYSWYNTFPDGAALAIESDDSLHWTYMWHGQKVDGDVIAAGEDIGYSDITVDGHGRLYVVYQQGGNLNLAVNAGCDGGWLQIQLASSTVSGDVSIAVFDNIIHITYYDSATQSLEHISLPVAAVVGQLLPLQINPVELAADNSSTGVITATVTDCGGEPLGNTPTTLEISPTLGSTFIESPQDSKISGRTNDDGIFTATLRAGLRHGDIVVTAISAGIHVQTATIHLEPAQEIVISVDNFAAKPLPGQSMVPYNLLNSDRGAMGDGEVNFVWGNGQVTATILSGTWGGLWTSLRHPDRENLPLNFSAILPPQVLPQYQSEITGLSLQIADAGSGTNFKIELKNGDALLWWDAISLAGGPQTLRYQLPPLGDVTHLNWLMESAAIDDYVVLENVALTATMPLMDAAKAAFVWSYAQLLDNWDPATGLVRDKAKDASGEFDAIQATGSLAAATAYAEQLDVISYESAAQIVDTISDTLLLEIPRYHGLWPHWVEILPSGTFTIVSSTEWSSVDTALAAIALLEAQSGLGLDTSNTEQILQSIDWDDLLLPAGISHGYTYSRERISATWDTFGGESWLMVFAYASATGQIAPIKYCQAPTANGSGFIDELAWMFLPPPTLDCWRTDWDTYRQTAVDTQLAYFANNYPGGCFDQLGLFGLSAAEAPTPWLEPGEGIYQPFGVGGRWDDANDGSHLLGAPVIVPHYSGMIASLRAPEAINMWGWLVNQGFFSPLNNVESLMFPADSTCSRQEVLWNPLKGSWNLALQSLGWGRYFAEQEGLTPVLWQAVNANTFLQNGYQAMSDLCNSSLVIDKKLRAPSSIAPGDSITYTIAFTNVGLPQATDVIIRDDLPGELIDVNFFSTGALITDTGASPTYIWDVQDLWVLEGGVITITGRLAIGLPGKHIFTNTAFIEGSLDDDTADNVSSVSVSVANVKPELDPIQDRKINVSATLVFTVTADDLNEDVLTFSLKPGVPAGMAIDQHSGILIWIPGESQGPGVYVVTAHVADNGSPPLDDEEAFTVTVLKPIFLPLIQNRASSKPDFGDRYLERNNFWMDFVKTIQGNASMFHTLTR